MSSRHARFQQIIVHWPLWAAILFFWLGLAVVRTAVDRKLGGQFAYALDDPYIHMAQARNLVQHGVWGVTRYAFSSTTSSPLWALLLAVVYKIGGVRDTVPLWLNALFATLVIPTLYLPLKRQNPAAPRLILLALVLLIIFMIPLLPLVFIGMEHTLQVWLILLLALNSATVLSRPRPPGWRPLMAMALLAALLVITRYEGMFLVIMVFLLSLLRRWWKLAIVVAVVSLLPLVLYGAMTSAQGAFWIPNPLLVKGNIPPLDSLSALLAYLFQTFFDLYAASRMTLLVALLWIVLTAFVWRYDPGRGLWQRWNILALLFGGMTLPHLLLAGSGLRYVAYIYGLGLLVLALLALQILEAGLPAWRRNWPRFAVLAALLTLTLMPAAVASGLAIYYTPQATAGIHEQQVQMGRFLARYYQGKTVAANDIGAITYYADIHLLDLIGLANNDVIRLRRDGIWDQATIGGLAGEHGVDVAIIYERWFEGALPAEWVKAGQWTTMHRAGPSIGTIAFFAVDATKAEILRQQLLEYGRQALPETVLQEIP